MRLVELLVLYGFFAAVVGGWSLRSSRRSPWLHALLWPLYLPSLLASSEDRFDTVRGGATSRAAVGRLGHALNPVVAGFRGALLTLETGLVELEDRIGALEAHTRGAPDGAQPVLQALLARLRAEHAAALTAVAELEAEAVVARFGGTAALGSQSEDLTRALRDLVSAVEAASEAARQVPRTRPQIKDAPPGKVSASP
jgi:hypothetical protein